MRQERATVTRTFTIYRERATTKPLARIAPGSRIKVILWGGQDWFGVESPHGLFGWVTSKTLGDHTTGLSMAD